MVAWKRLGIFCMQRLNRSCSLCVKFAKSRQKRGLGTVLILKIHSNNPGISVFVPELNVVIIFMHVFAIFYRLLLFFSNDTCIFDLLIHFRLFAQSSATKLIPKTNGRFLCYFNSVTIVIVTILSVGNELQEPSQNAYKINES